MSRITKETIEEFAERLCPNKQVEYDMILEGAKWQQPYIDFLILELRHTRSLLGSCATELDKRDEKNNKLYIEAEVLEFLNGFMIFFWQQKNKNVEHSEFKQWFNWFKEHYEPIKNK